MKQDHYKEIQEGEEGDIENVIFWLRIEKTFLRNEQNDLIEKN